MSASHEAHECYYRGCRELVSIHERYCERHEAIDKRRKAIIAERMSERARRRRAA